MNQDLHDVLERTADLAGRAEFDSDALWRQATRTKRRHGAVAAIGVCAALALLSLSIWWGNGPTTRSPAPPASSTVAPAMPSHLYNPPADVASAPDLAMGPLAAVFLPTERGDALVAVSAIDGSYRTLNLPGYVGRFAELLDLSPAAVLSPDGNRLAYAWQPGGVVPGDPRGPGGVRLVDLHSGAISSYRVRDGLGTTCGGLAWSRNGQYLAYTCFDHGGDIDGRAGFRVLVLRLDTTSGIQIRVPGGGSGALVGVRDSGIVAVPDGRKVSLVNPEQGRISGDPAHWSIDERLGSAAWVENGGGLVMMGQDLAQDTSRGVLLEFITGIRAAPERHLDGVYGRVAGPVDYGSVAVWVMQSHSGELSTFSPTTGLRARVTFVGLAPHEVSFATALLQRPTRDTPDPNAMSTWQRLGAPMSLVAAAVLLLLGLFVVVVVVKRQRMLRQA